MSEQLVVVGVDGSPASFTALRWALAHAVRIGAAVRTVRCWTPVSTNGWETAVTAEPVPPCAVQETRTERELADVVEAACRQVPGGAAQIAVRRRVVRGPTGPMLVAEAHGAAMLVVGSHGHRRITELLHRSVSLYCERHATCPVLVIPPAMATQRALGAITAPATMSVAGAPS